MTYRKICYYKIKVIFFNIKTNSYSIFIIPKNVFDSELDPSNHTKMDKDGPIRQPKPKIDTKALINKMRNEGELIFEVKEDKPSFIFKNK